MTTCAQRRENDEYVCSCGKRWDVNEPEPPGCLDTNKTPNFIFASGAKDPFENAPKDRRFFAVDIDSIQYDRDNRSISCVVTLPNTPTVTLPLPIELPEGLAQRMAIAFQHLIENPAGHLVREPAQRSKAMRAAYRILLDELSK